MTGSRAISTISTTTPNKRSATWTPTKTLRRRSPTSAGRQPSFSTTDDRLPSGSTGTTATCAKRRSSRRDRTKTIATKQSEATMLLEIAQLGQPVLWQVAAEVPLEQIARQPLQELLSDMRETLKAQKGAGLA